MKKLFLLVGICILFHACNSQPNAVETTFKFNGVSFVGNPKPVGEAAFSKVTSIHSNAITLMPFAYGTSGEASLTFENLNWQWWGEGPEGVESCIQQALAKNLRVIIKPQIWIRNGSFTGHHFYTSDEDWSAFEEDYTKYILIYAELSAKYDLPAFCIGTELCTFAETRPDYWRDLIQQVRAIYPGKLTYAANWDSYSRLPFWDELDYIGIDAYFPLSEAQTPSVEELRTAWKPICQELETFSKKHNAPILFMEWGYRSTDYCAKTPWETGKGNEVNLVSQANAITAVFEELWEKQWFAGGFIWKWFPDGSRGGPNDNRFTPQDKPAEQVISKYFQQFK